MLELNINNGREFTLDFIKYMEDTLGSGTIYSECVRGFDIVSYAPEGVKLPSRKTSGSSCYDFYLPCDVTVPPNGMSKTIELYIKAYMPKNEALLLFVRSSIGIKKGLVLANGTGIIDSDYYNCAENEGNIMIRLVNYTDEYQYLKAGDRVVQGMFIEYHTADNDDVVEERTGGVGSSGK